MKEKAICSTQGNPDRGSQRSTWLKSAHSATTGHHDDEMGILDTSNQHYVLRITTWHSHGKTDRTPLKSQNVQEVMKALTKTTVVRNLQWGMNGWKQLFSSEQTHN